MRRFLFASACSALSPTASTVPGDASRDSGASAAKRSTFAQPGLEGLRIAAYAPTEPGVLSSLRRPPVSVGHVVAQLSFFVFAVDFNSSPAPSAVSLGSRVYVAYEREDVDLTSQHGSGGVESAPSRVFLVGGLVVRVNPSGSLSVLLDNNKIDLAVPPEKIAVSEGVCKFLNHPKYLQVVEWVRSAGLTEKDDVESTACTLYHRGWRAERLYLLEASDIRSMAHLSQCARMSLLEKAEWQRDHHRQMRNIYRERVKELDRRYMSAKYAGILSASVAFCGAFSLFWWNYRNYLTHQRSYQMRLAVKTLCKKVPRGSDTTIDEALEDAGVETSSSPSPAHRPLGHVSRVAQERWLRHVFNQLDTAHPRIVVITGYFGCGKTSLCRTAIQAAGMAGVFVDVRNKEDTLRSVIKALGVPHVEACGDPLDFISEACRKAQSISGGKTPVIVLKLREGDSLARVYNEALTLACDRRSCHIVVELPLESLTTTNTLLPRLDFYTVPNFSRSQAYEYIQHRLDALDMKVFLDTVGTNSNDLDEVLAAAHQHGVSPTEHTNQKLTKAMRRLQTAWGDDAQLKAAVKRLAQLPYDEGQHEGVDDTSLNHPSLRDVIFYNSVQDVWLFKSQALHTAASCLL
ncbi:tuzin, putative [Leishmania tarentolae]|uniref:Tuzin, putative n=1 Tax=Leishmania tarentolae TaxID=5689 RepID=A0A640KEN1_LEITA|nr:tuzin, putative [Leishmania tarentolae]